MNKWRQRAIDTKAMYFTFIGTQLYKQGNDHQLRLYDNEKEYLPILAQAHAGIAGGYFSADTTIKANTLQRRKCLCLRF